MSFLAVYESHFTKHLTQTQFEAFRILLWLLTVHKQVRQSLMIFKALKFPNERLSKMLIKVINKIENFLG